MLIVARRFASKTLKAFRDEILIHLKIPGLARFQRLAHNLSRVTSRADCTKEPL
jgi:hypothetical protein